MLTKIYMLYQFSIEIFISLFLIPQNIYYQNKNTFLKGFKIKPFKKA
jgi:hypothetical protein